jgi:hypothetical protein
MSGNADDPDQTSVAAIPDTSTLPVECDTAGSDISTVNRDVATNAQGRQPSTLCDVISAAANAARELGVDAATIQAAGKIVKDAAAKWNKAWVDGGAPKKRDLDDADKAVDDAKAATKKAGEAEVAAEDALNAARNAPDVGGYNSGRQAAVDAAQSKLDAAKKNLDAATKAQDKAVAHARDLHEKRKTADEDLKVQVKRAEAKLREVKRIGGQEKKGADGSGEGYGGGNGKSADTTGSGPTTGKSTSPGGGAGSTSGSGSGSGSAKPGTTKPGGAAMPKMPTVPGGQTTSPSTNTSGTPSSDTNDIAKLLGGMSQNGQQPQAAQQAGLSQPSSVTPTTAQQPQQQDGKDKKSTDEAGNPITTDDLIREGALPASAAGTSAALSAVGALGGTSPSAPAPVTPQSSAAPANTTTNTASQAAPATSGRSETNLVTNAHNTEVGGRPQGTENKPYSPAPAGTETRLSAAGDAGTNAKTGTATGANPAQGMNPGAMVPHAAPGVAAPAGGSARSKDDAEKGRVKSATDNLGLYEEVSKAVDGGTIAQNKERNGRAA